MAPTLLSVFENPNRIIQIRGHTTNDKYELKSIKTRVDDAEVPILLWNKLWRNIREIKGQTTGHEWESALKGSR